MQFNLPTVGLLTSLLSGTALAACDQAGYDITIYDGDFCDGSILFQQVDPKQPPDPVDCVILEGSFVCSSPALKATSPASDMERSCQLLTHWQTTNATSIDWTAGYPGT